MVKVRLVSANSIFLIRLSLKPSDILLGSSESCNTAFHQPNDNQVQVQCEEDNVSSLSRLLYLTAVLNRRTQVNLLITFCGDATSAAAPSAPAKPASSSSKPAVAASSTHDIPSSAPVHIASSSSSAVIGTTAASSSAITSTASAPSASASVNRSTCKAKRGTKRAQEGLAELTERSNQEARELYDLHARRQHARARAHANARRSH